MRLSSSRAARRESFARSEIAERGFCAACGTPLTYRNVTSARISVTIGTLDDPNAVAPELQLGAEAPCLGSRACAGRCRTRSVDDWLDRQTKIADVGNHQHPDHET